MRSRFRSRLSNWLLSFGLLPLTASVLPACGAPEDADEVVVTEDAQKTDSVAVLTLNGAYRNKSLELAPGLGGLQTIAFDVVARTFTAEVALCAGGASCRTFPRTGHYQLTKKGKKTYLTLTYDEGYPAAKYGYTIETTGVHQVTLTNVDDESVSKLVPQVERAAGKFTLELANGKVGFDYEIQRCPGPGDKAWLRTTPHPTAATKDDVIADDMVLARQPGAGLVFAGWDAVIGYGYSVAFPKSGDGGPSLSVTEDGRTWEPLTASGAATRIDATKKLATACERTALRPAK